MSWAARRRFLILLLIGAVVLAIAAVTLIATLHHTPSCTDGIQNQGEQGIDCGGPCPYLCSALEQAPTVLFTKAIPNGTGRTDVVAEVVNKNADAAAKGVAYTITLYDASHAFVQSVSGTLDLPPATSVSVFVPGVASGNQVVASAFLSVQASSIAWFKQSGDPRLLPKISNVTAGGTPDAPRVEAVLTDPSTTPLTQVKVIALVKDDAGNVIAASQTILPTIPGQGSATATFTWGAPFPGNPATIDVEPVIPLP